MKVFAVLALCLTAVSADKLFTTLENLNIKNNRIVSGEPAVEGQFPWQVAIDLRKPSNSYFCGGALISDSWVLTAAHCVDGVLEFTFHFGTIVSNEGVSQTVNGSNAIQHEGFNPMYMHNDIAVIKLDTPVSGTNIAPIPLPVPGDIVLPEDTLTISGWGNTSDEATEHSLTLQFTQVNAIFNFACRDVYGSMIINSTLCCEGDFVHGPCDGDSGGPLVKDGVHAGLASFVHITGCETGNPSGYVRTESMLPWIKANTGIGI